MRLTDELPARGARVEMIPLIDAMFLLLAFFVVAILSMEFFRGMPVNLAAATTATTLAEPHGIVVTVRRDGDLLIDGEPVAVEALEGAIRAQREASGDGPVIVAADAAVAFSLALDVLDHLRAANIEQVFLQTRRSEP